MNFDNHQHQNQQQPSTGLLRFRSAPSSLFSISCDNLDSDRFYTRLLNDFEEKSMASTGEDDGVMINAAGESSYENDYSLLPPQYPRQTSKATSTSPISVDGGSYGASGSAKTTANLVRQNSSPTGFFSQLNPQNGYGSTRGGVSFRQVNISQSRLGQLPQISEIGDESIEEPNSPDDVHSQFYGSGFPVSPWISNDASEFIESDEKLFCGTQKNGVRVLSHHISLPKNGVVIEKLMQLQDSVPCRTRAKRGCATHPRSIAERVRRTRISERMRKLQELVPSMDKQTNTAAMLDLAVDYIKDLQKQFKTLSETKAKCKCSNKQT